MERRVLSEEERAILRSLLNERMAQGVGKIAVRYDADWTPAECFRLLKKIDGPGKLIVVESEQPFAFGTDSAVSRAEESGCG